MQTAIFHPLAHHTITQKTANSLCGEIPIGTIIGVMWIYSLQQDAGREKTCHLSLKNVSVGLWGRVFRACQALALRRGYISDHITQQDSIWSRNLTWAKHSTSQPWSHLLQFLHGKWWAFTSAFSHWIIKLGLLTRYSMIACANNYNFKQKCVSLYLLGMLGRLLFS